ncbi:MAG: imidazolonepropionase [Thermaerobacter sp.]|nr:imidazolonepropionase [Thermaerobacter sp.]
MRTLIQHGRIYTVAGPSAPRRGLDLGRYPIYPDGAVVCEDGWIRQVGPTASLGARASSFDAVIDAGGHAVVPGLVDCHTHLPFAGWRTDEYRARLSGISYQQLAGQDGGIRYSARQFQQHSDDEILRFTEPLVAEALKWGTTTLEMKTGYGLSVAQELRALKLIERLQHDSPVRIAATGLFLHAVPPGLDAAAWVRQVLAELLPEASASPFITAIDAFIEATAFRPEQAAPVLKAARQAGLLIRLHTDQFTAMGGIGLGIEYGARSLDHLEAAAAKDLQALAASPAVAVLLPTAAFYTNSNRQPAARELLARGAALALATDFNPGTSPVGNLPTVMALAVNLLGLSPEEALAAVTANAAYVLGLERLVGSIEPGKVADLVILDDADIAGIPYRLGHNPVTQVLRWGRPVG